jgi:hypothetical protein
LDTLVAELFIGMYDRFRVRARAKNMSALLQFSAQVLEVINLPIENHPDRVILVGEGLLGSF